MFDTTPARQQLRVLTDEDGDGYTLAEGDCNDHDPQVHPDAVDDCDGADTNCDGRIDEIGLLEPLCRDDDGDGHGDPATASFACELAEGRVALCDDCNDRDSDVSPAAAERCDGFDNNCDAQVDGDDAVDRPTWYRDEDTDGYGDDSSSIRACGSSPGYVSERGDCDDRQEAVHPGAEEVCGDGADNNCDGEVPECGFWGDQTMDPTSVEPSIGGFIRGTEANESSGAYGLEVVDTLADGSGDVVAFTPNVSGSPERIDLWYSAPVGNETIDDSQLTIHSPGGSYMGACGNLPVVDVDGDGRKDLLICAPLDMDGFDEGGRLFAVPVGLSGDVTLGPEDEVLGDGPHWSLFGRQMDESATLCEAPSVVVGSYVESYARDDRGLIRAYEVPFGGATEPLATIIGVEVSDALGERNLLVSDVDADGVDDLLATVDAPDGAVGGSVRVFHGPLHGAAQGDDADLQIEGQNLQAVGFDLSVTPDLTGDGVPEIYVGSDWLVTKGDPQVGGWLSGALTGTADLVGDSDLVWTFAAADRTGLDLRVGDLNGDGVLDVAAGAGGLDDDRGAFFGYYGPLRFAGQEAFSAQSSFVRRGAESGTYLGWRVDVGDVDADGTDDLLFYGEPVPTQGYGGAWFLFGEGI